jgi:hypothetical protein
VRVENVLDAPLPPAVNFRGTVSLFFINIWLCIDLPLTENG